MTTTTGDSSTLKSSSSLSGGDLVSRLLAATPPYLYNVPITPHSFFFSEMLRSFVQAKTESSCAASAASTLPNCSAAAISVTTLTNNRRRKRSWRDSRDRPLELTMSTSKDRGHSESGQNFGDQSDNQEDEVKSSIQPLDQRASSDEVVGDNQQSDHCFVKQSRNFYDDSSRLFGTERIVRQEAATSQNVLSIIQKSDDNREKTIPELPLYNTEHKNNKVDFSAKNLMVGLSSQQPADHAAVAEPSKVGGFLPAQPLPNPEFLPNPSLWYPPYNPLPQSYSGIDPLHFFIDLRVSGHIWDRKLGENKHISSSSSSSSSSLSSSCFKSKHCSAFSVPQTKEYNNRPLNLTRDDVALISKQSEENLRGTHSILKNLVKTYKDMTPTKIKLNEDRNNKEDERQEQCSVHSIDDSSKEDESCPSRENSKDIRALIGLELVVDYVKGPKEELSDSISNVADE